MKKFFVMGMIALAAVFCMTSCGGPTPEEKAQEMTEQMIEAAKKGETDKIATITKDMEAYSKTLSAEDQKKFEDAFEKAFEEKIKSLSEAEQMALVFSMMGAASENSGLGADTEEISEATEEVEEETSELQETAGKVKDVANAVEQVADAANSLGKLIK